MSNILGRLKALQFIFHGGVSFQGGGGGFLFSGPLIML